MSRFSLEQGPVPFHHQVYLDLRRRLESNEWAAGDRLPPERQLAERYGCSLITVRRALTDLAREQRLERTRGRGTFVLKPRIDRDFHAELSFTDEMRSRGLVPETRVIAARMEAADQIVADGLQIPPGESIVYLERLRAASGEPLLLEQVSLPAGLFPGLLDEDLENRSLYDVLLERYGIRVARTRETLEPSLLPSRAARLLGDPPRGLALLVEGIAYAVDGTPVEYGRTYVRGDRTRYYVERVVLRPSWQSSAGGPPLQAGWRHDGVGGLQRAPGQEEEADQREEAVAGTGSR